MAKKITETGPVGLRGIRNQDLYNNLYTLASEGDPDAQGLLQSLSMNKSRPADAGSDIEAYFTPQQYESRTAYADLGKSQYDSPYIMGGSEEDVNEIRYENQPWYDVLANGVGKMLGKAATTFVSSLVGIPYGIGTAISEGRWSGLWDNDVTQGLSNVDKWLEENMTNYQSKAQQEDPHFRLGDLNWWADNVITNMGFTLGAAASMAVGAGSLGLMSKSLGLVNDIGKTGKGASNFISALFSATGEGMIEAKQGVEERNKLEFQRLDDAFAPEREALNLEYQNINQEYEATKDQYFYMDAEGRAHDPAYDTYQQRMQDYNAKMADYQQRYNAGKQQIVESGEKMGNAILGLNQALLTAGNLIQFSKGMTKSFDAARHAAETSSKAAKPFGMRAVRVSDDIKDGYKTVGKTFGRTMVAPKNMIKEGSEEMNQQWIQSGAGAYYNEKDVNDYWKAKLDPEAYKETTEGLHTLGSAISQGFRESWGDGDQWEQFLIGAMTGLSGSYVPTKLFNQDKTKSRLNPARYGEWSGGVFQDIREYNQQARQFEENVEDLNKILASEDFPARVRSMVGHTYTEQEKDAAVEGDDKKAWKDADDKQMIHDIQAFLRAGKLDDLRAIYDEIGTEMTDEDVENIIKSTTKEITAEEDKQNSDRYYDGLIAEHQRKITELQQQTQDIGDSQEVLEGSERVDYQAAVRPKLEEIFGQIDAEYDAISQLEQEKQQYVPQKYYEGTYVDREGNQIVSNDEIKQSVKHNSEELNRKLDSYLGSIDYVNRRTKGALTKDQEDNLAYLHNMGKESNVRMQKIMADVRQQLPKTFLLKTSKTPEQLAKENASSDLTFTKDENTKEGYVEVDTSLMNDATFADFFQREVMRGGNIRPEFGETTEERAIREEEEKNLPEAERKKVARERASKKWQSAIQKMQDDANEQWDTNWRNLVDNFMDNYKKSNNATLDETVEAFQQVRQNLQDASDLFDQAGEYQRTLMEYMANPSKVDEDKAKAEATAQKAETEQQQKKTFEGKDARQMKQELAEGVMDENEFSDFANMDLSGDAPAPLAEAHQEAKKAQEGNQKASALKQHIQEQLGENPTQQEINEAQIAMQMVDAANLAADNPEDLNIDMPELNQVPLDAVDPNASVEDVDALNMDVQQMLADAFNAFEEDKNAQDDIPEVAPAEALNGVETPETGHDATTKTKPEVVTPKNSAGKPSGTVANGPINPASSFSPSEAIKEPIPNNSLTEGAIDTIITETSNSTKPQNSVGTWRSCTTRHPYGKSTGTYHETLADKDSIQYKRSKAIWEYLNEEGAFDKQENSSADRIKSGDVVHFMVRNIAQEVFGTEYRRLKPEDKPFALVILMLNENGEVIGDLPLAQLEPSYGSENPSQQVKDLLSLQDKVFGEYEKNDKTGSEYSVLSYKNIVVDGVLQKDNTSNMGMTFDNSKKPLVSRVKQVMRGAVPYRKSETNTLNDVANGQPFELGVAVTGTNVAKKRGDKTQHTEIVMPHVGNIGQPYLLLPTPSGEQIAVPFYMKPFDANQHRNTEFYKILSNAMYNLLANNSYSTAEQKEAFNKAIDVIEGLLQIKAQEGVRTVMVGSDSISFYFQSLTDPNQKITITAPNASGNVADIIRVLVDQLSGIPINVSLQFLNDTIEAGGRKANYNNVIGEIADVNLPKATNHTVNGWFTVELAPSAGLKNTGRRGEVKPKTTGVISENIEGRNIEINADTLVAYDPTTGEVILDNEEVNLRLAQIKAAKPQYQGKDRIQVSINGELRTYDTKENKFVKNASIKKETPATPQPTAEETPDVSAVTPPTSGAVPSAKQTKAPSTIEIDVPTTTGEPRKERVQKVNPFELKKGDPVWYSGPETEKPIGRDTILAIINGEVWGNRGLIKSKAIYKVVFNDKNSNTKTLEQIESEMKQKKIVGRQTKYAWDAIPNDLKLKMANEGQPLQLSFNGKTMVVSLSDREGLIQGLTQANMAAKAGNLIVSKAPKYRKVDNTEQKKANIQREKRWLQKNLPMFSTEDRLKLIQGLIEIPGAEGWAWGRFQSGVITLSDMAAAGTTYHEAFHAVTQTLLNDDELDSLYEAAMERYKETDAALLEEFLAEDFRKYVQREETPIIGYIRKVFRRILHVMKNLESYRNPINLLFYKINNGEFKDTLPKESRDNNAFYNKVRTDRLLDRNHPMSKYIEAEFNKKRWEGDFPALNKKWGKFRDVYQAEGYTPVAERIYSSSGRGSLKFIGVRTNADEYLSKKEYEKKNREQYAAQQAREGGIEKMKWDRLTPEQQMNLMNDGMTEDAYNKMALEEKEQWVKCHS